MIIAAKYPSKCACCRQPIAAGSKIEWSKGCPARHAACAGSVIVTAQAPVGYSRASYSGRARRPGRWTGCSCGSREDSAGDLIPAKNNCASCMENDH